MYVRTVRRQPQLNTSQQQAALQNWSHSIQNLHTALVTSAISINVLKLFFHYNYGQKKINQEGEKNHVLLLYPMRRHILRYHLVTAIMTRTIFEKNQKFEKIVEHKRYKWQENSHF